MGSRVYGPTFYGAMLTTTERLQGGLTYSWPMDLGQHQHEDYSPEKVTDIIGRKSEDYTGGEPTGFPLSMQRL